MRHLDDGALRRLYDDPLAVPMRARQHQAACARCRERYTGIVARARLAAALLGEPEPPYEPEAGFEVRGNGARTQAPRRRWGPWTGEVRPAVPAHLRWALARWFWPGRKRGRTTGLALGLALLVAVAGGALVPRLAPAGQAAFTVLEPQQIAAVPVGAGDLQGLPDLRAYGTMQVDGPQDLQSVPDAAAASAALGGPLRSPSTLPPGLSARVRYQVLPRSTSSFTFSRARAGAAAAAAHRVLPPPPPGLDGAVLRVVTGPAVVVAYGQSALLGQAVPLLVVVQASPPQVGVRGATLGEFESYLLRLPGITPQVATAIRSIGEAGTTLPIPIPSFLAGSTRTVQIDGVRGLAIDYAGGLAGAVIWERPSGRGTSGRGTSGRAERGRAWSTGWPASCPWSRCWPWPALCAERVAGLRRGAEQCGLSN